MTIETSTEMQFARDLFNRAKVRRLRTISEFAEDEIVIPSGPHAGLRFRLDRHPVSRLLFRELESGRWRRAFVTGPNQDGKTFMAFIIIIMYLLFERGERVVMGVPNEATANDKYQLEILPVLKSTRYYEQMPKRGGGSAGGMPDMIEFTGGGVLRTMTAGGDDQSRSHFTAPNLLVTETEAFDEVGSNSREGSKFFQLEKRLLGYPEAERFEVAECTVSDEKGRTWFEYTHSTESRIALPCPHCGEYVCPERKDLRGWQGAMSAAEAARLARVYCPNCEEPWTNDERLTANRYSVLLHKGQHVDADGNVIGPIPDTTTLGFRWNCINAAVNADRMSDVAKAEWVADTLPDGEDADNAQKDLCQAQWVIPGKARITDIRVIDAAAIQRRMLGDFGPGVVPDDVEFITVGCDVGKWLLHWDAIGWRADATPHVIEYGRIDVPSDAMAEEFSIPNAIHQLHDRVEKGWSTRSGKLLHSAYTLVDCGWHQKIVVPLIAQLAEPWYPVKGYGYEQRRGGEYKRDTGSKIVAAGEGYAKIRLPNGDILWEFDSDYWMGWLQNRMTAQLGQPGAFTLYYTSKQNDHLAFVMHHINERQVEEFVPGVGMRKKWVNPSHASNHWGDASKMACVAGHICGARLTGDEVASIVVQQNQPVQQQGFVNAYKGKYS